MTGSALLTFNEALDMATSAGGKKHVLLGNGFSIGAHDKFRYGTLYEQAKALGLSQHVEALFERYGTTNFEDVLHHLDEAAWIADHYKLARTDKALDMRADYESLKNILAQAIVSVHPGSRAEVPDPKLTACNAFLENFNCVFTTNYDLLLYWASLVVEPFRFGDGFGREEDTGDDYVVFLQASDDSPHVYYLHGALHLYVAEGDVRKMIWSNTGIPLIDQVSAALERKRYPLVVSEGSSADKSARIEASSYLSQCRRKIENIQGTLFVYGSSLSEQDAHILDGIVHNTTLARLCVGIYGDPMSDANVNLMERLNALPARRQNAIAEGLTGGHKKALALEVSYFDTKTVDVWGPA